MVVKVVHRVDARGPFHQLESIASEALGVTIYNDAESWAQVRYWLNLLSERSLQRMYHQGVQ